MTSQRSSHGSCVSCTAGQSDSSLTQIADLESELQQLQALNARLEEDLLAAEHTGSRLGRPPNGHPLDPSHSGSGLSGPLGQSPLGSCSFDCLFLCLRCVKQQGHGRCDCLNKALLMDYDGHF